MIVSNKHVNNNNNLLANILSKDISSTSTGQPRAGMVALQDPITQEIKSEPDKLETWSMLSFQHHFTL
jgi:hypothetical protein